MTRSSSARFACATLVAGLAAACASGLPAVLSSTPDSVSIEFSTDGSLAETKKLASEECAKHDLIPKFDVVDKTATPTTRVAKYHCVSPNVAGPAPEVDPMDTGASEATSE